MPTQTKKMCRISDLVLTPNKFVFLQNIRFSIGAAESWKVKGQIQKWTTQEQVIKP